MRKQLLAVALVIGGTLGVMSEPVQAGGPLFRPGSTKRNIAQPFSTKRGRQLEAARRQRNSRSLLFQRSNSRGLSYSQINRSQSQWPGAIGGPSPRYQFFQDINGYWY